MLPLLMKPPQTTDTWLRVAAIAVITKQTSTFTDAQLRLLMDALEYEMCNRLAEQLTHTD